MNGFTDLDEFIIQHTLPRIVVLKAEDPEKMYLAAELCADFWRAFEGIHTLIGRRVKELSLNHMLPIEPIGRTSCNKHLYRLK